MPNTQRTLWKRHLTIFIKSLYRAIERMLFRFVIGHPKNFIRDDNLIHPVRAKLVLSSFKCKKIVIHEPPPLKKVSTIWVYPWAQFQFNDQ